jgi:hypothetical protein
MQVALLIDGAVFTGLSTEDTISDCKFSIGNEWQASMPAYHQLTNMTSQHVRSYHQLRLDEPARPLLSPAQTWRASTSAPITTKIRDVPARSLLSPAHRCDEPARSLLTPGHRCDEPARSLLSQLGYVTCQHVRSYHPVTDVTSQHVRSYHPVTDVTCQHVHVYHPVTDMTSQHVRSYHQVTVVSVCSSHAWLSTLFHFVAVKRLTCEVGANTLCRLQRSYVCVISTLSITYTDRHTPRLLRH